MKRPIQTLAAFTLIAAFCMSIFSSCGKYEEGPGFSVLPKKSRLTGKWQSKKYVNLQTNNDTTDNSSIVEFKKDNTYIASSTQSSFQLQGEWQFSDDKKFLYVTYTFGSSSTTDTSLILRLKNNELWLADKDREDYEVHYTKQ